MCKLISSKHKVHRILVYLPEVIDQHACVITFYENIIQFSSSNSLDSILFSPNMAQ